MIAEQLLEPEELPAYEEEPYADPFGLRTESLRQSARRTFELLLRLVEPAHAQGIAMTLPEGTSGSVELDSRPWRSVARTKGSGGPEFLTADLVESAYAHVPFEPPDDASILHLFQRAFVCRAATAPLGAADEWGGVAELIEELGYVLLSRTFNAERMRAALEDNPLLFYFRLGALAAKLHMKGVLHGDLHPENFGFQDGNVIIRDAGSGRFTGRTLSERERARDLGLLKLTVRFAEWEAVKLGYREEARDAAPAVLALLGG